MKTNTILSLLMTMLLISCNEILEEEFIDCVKSDITLTVVNSSNTAYAGMKFSLNSKPLPFTTNGSEQVADGTTDAFGRIDFQDIGCGEFFITTTDRTFPKPFLTYYNTSNEPAGKFTRSSAEEVDFKIVLREVVPIKGGSESNPHGSINPTVNSLFGAYQTSFTSGGTLHSIGAGLDSNTKYLSQRFVSTSTLDACGVGLGITSANHRNSLFTMQIQLFDESEGAPNSLLFSDTVYSYPSSYGATSYRGIGSILDFCIKNNDNAVQLASGTAYWLVVEILDNVDILGLQYKTHAENSQASHYFVQQSEDGVNWNAMYHYYQTEVDGVHYNIPSSVMGNATTQAYINSPETFIGDKLAITLFIIK